LRRSFQVDRFDTAAAFLASAEPFLLKAEVENNLILGIAHRLATGTSEQGIDPYFATVREGDAICMAAFRTLPTRAGVTRALRAEAVAPLVADVVDACPAVREIVGPEPTAADVARQLAAVHGLQSRRRMSQRIYELRTVESLDGLPAGRLRAAQQSDAALLADWVKEFLVDIGDRGEPEPPAPRSGQPVLLSLHGSRERDVERDLPKDWVSARIGCWRLRHRQLRCVSINRLTNDA